MTALQKEIYLLEQEIDNLYAEKQKHEAALGASMANDDKTLVPSNDKVQEIAEHEAIPAPSKSTLRVTLGFYFVMLFGFAVFWMLSMNEVTLLSGASAFVLSLLFGALAIVVSFVVFRFWYFLRRSSAVLPAKQLRRIRFWVYFITLVALVVEASVTGWNLINLNEVSSLGANNMPIWIAVGVALASLFMVGLAALAGHFNGLWEIATIRTRRNLRENPENRHSLEKLAAVSARIRRLEADLTELEAMPSYSFMVKDRVRVELASQQKELPANPPLVLSKGETSGGNHDSI